MRIKFKNTVLLTAAALLALSVSGCGFGGTGQSPSPSPSAANTLSPPPSPEATVMNQDDISEAIKGYGDKAIDVTWSPDSSAVAFIKLETDGDYVYVWKQTSSDAKKICKASETTDGFIWSPNARYFLIDVGHMGPGTITSTIVDTSTMTVNGKELTTVSVSPPVWSADSRFIALSADDESTNAVSIVIYSVAGNSQVSVAQSTNKNGPYIVKSWDESNNLVYTEAQPNGTRTEKTIGIGE